MSDLPLHYQSITELAASLQKGDITSTQLTEHLLDRIQALDGTLNAFRVTCPEQALAAAERVDHKLKHGHDMGLLHGIPYAAKDLFDVKGLPTSAGAKLLESNIASDNATAVRRLWDAGMILAGKTNTVQFAFSGVGINHDHGTPHNPWRQTHCIPAGVRTQGYGHQSGC